MRLPSKNTTFVLLMVVSAASAFLLPRPWTRPLRMIFQPLALPQWVATSVGRETRAVVAPAAPSQLSAAAVAELEDENRALKALVINQQAWLAEYRNTLDDATGLREQLPDKHTRLILAAVVAYDANPRRQTMQVALTNAPPGLVEVGQWVAAGTRPRAAAGLSGRELLRRQWVVGQVVEVQTKLARVQLTADPTFRCEVRLARLPASAGEDVPLTIADERNVLDGKGGQRMVITQAQADYPAAGFDTVVVPVSERLPHPLVLGRVTEARQRDDSSKHYDLEVAPWGDPHALSHVFIISVQP
jgi:cell shape-determining protein MreC